MIDQDNYRDEKSSLIEHDMQIEKQEASDIMSVR